MDSEILVDTSVLIDFFRKRNKAKSALFGLVDEYRLCISVITDFEVRVGIRSGRQEREYAHLLENVSVLPLDAVCITEAVTIYQDLHDRNALIGLADLLIAATALAHDLRIARLNVRHFDRVEAVHLLSLS